MSWHIRLFSGAGNQVIPLALARNASLADEDCRSRGTNIRQILWRRFGDSLVLLNYACSPSSFELDVPEVSLRRRLPSDIPLTSITAPVTGDAARYSLWYIALSRSEA